MSTCRWHWREMLLLAFAFACPALGLDNGQMQTPAMGFNTWNGFHDNITEELVLQTVDLMVELGLSSAGYEYINIDDGWSEKQRDKDGKLEADRTRFPSGIKFLADYIHSKGMKLGIYSDAGTATCMAYPASLGHEKVDADTFASWEVDLLKYDNCNSVDPLKVSVRTRYEAMRDALNQTGRHIAYSMCEWGVSGPWEYGKEVGNSWRTNADISLGIIADWRGIVDNLDAMAGLARYAGPGAWNDADLLEVGLPGSKNLSPEEQQAHFALWAIVKSPLLIGANLRRLGTKELAILRAKEVIALNQDPLGVAGDLVWKQGPKEVWAAPLAGGDRGVVLFNRHLNSDRLFEAANLSVSWDHLGLAPTSKAHVRDLFLEQDLGVFEGSFSASVRNHGVLALRISPLETDSGERDLWRPWHRGIATDAIDGSQSCPDSTSASTAGSCHRLLSFEMECCPVFSVTGPVYLLYLGAGFLSGVISMMLYVRFSKRDKPHIRTVQAC